MSDARKKQPIPKDWYLERVYRDIDFRKDVASLRSIFEARYFKGVRFDLHPKRNTTKLNPEDNLLVEDLANRYFLSVEELCFYTDGYYSGTYAINRREAIALFTDDKKKEITIKIGKDTTLDDLKQAWPTIEWFKVHIYGKGRTKYKAPENPDIIYAILKCKQKKMTQSQIFKLYEAGTLLNGRSYSHTQFSTVDSLMRYYNKYRPDRTEPE